MGRHAILLAVGVVLFAPAAFGQSDEADESSSEPTESVQSETPLDTTPDTPATEPGGNTETPTVNAGPEFTPPPPDEREVHLDPGIEYAGDKFIEKEGEKLLGKEAGTLLGLPKDNSAESWTGSAVDTAAEKIGEKVGEKIGEKIGGAALGKALGAFGGPFVSGILDATPTTKEGDEIDPKHPPEPFVQDPYEQLRIQTGLDIAPVPDSEVPAQTAQPADDPPVFVAPPDVSSDSSSSPSYDQGDSSGSFNGSGATDTYDSSDSSGEE